MTDAAPASGHDHRDLLVAELGVLRARLLVAARTESGPPDPGEIEAAAADLQAVKVRSPEQSPLDLLTEGFGLTDFERSVLLLTAGPELVAAVGDELQAAFGRSRPTFGLALALLPESHWSAMTPASPLRWWRLIRLVDPISPAQSPLVIDERVLHHLVGAGHLDADLAAIARMVPTPAWLPVPMRSCADTVARRWTQERAVLLHGPQQPNLRAIAATAATQAGMRLLSITGADIPTDPAERDRTLRLMERETILSGWAWAFDLAGGHPSDLGSVARAIAGLEAPVVVLAGLADSVHAGELRADPVRVERLEVADRRELLTEVLHRQHVAEPPSVELDAAAGIFDLDLESAEFAAQEAAYGIPLWEACRSSGRAAFSGLASVIQPRATWDDLILPEPQMEQLRALVSVVRHRATVLDDWGFGARTSRGLGTAALFAGPSGTGKTLAGEVIAGAVGLDLVHVDVSQVVSKYIGETPKNLERLFDAAEDSAAVLLFDEADALFGRRSEVRDSHDRYANLEVGYLLQRMESFTGLAILTTNARETLDPAFLRRLHTIVTFPYPTARARESLWQIAFPPAVPREGVEAAELARIDLPGGGIAAAALAASYLAADDGEPVRPSHIRTAARWELAKAGGVLPETATDGSAAGRHG